MTSAINQKFEEIAADIAKYPVILYMKGSADQPMCRFSLDVVRVLKDYDISFETRNVLEDDILREAIKEFSNWPTIPQLYVHGNFIGGRDIILDLHEDKDLIDIFTSDQKS